MCYCSLSRILLGYLLLTLILGSMACQSDAPTPPDLALKDSTTIVPIDTPSLEVLTGLPVTLVVRVPQTPVYQAPDFLSNVLQTVFEGDSLPFTNRLTTQRKHQTIQGITYHEPWLRVLLPDDQLGWIHAPTVQFDAAFQPELTQSILYPRAADLFGPSIAQQLGIYQQELQTVRTLPGFRALYTRAHELKDSLEMIMRAYAQRSPNYKPDFFWLNDLMPGFLVHQLPEQRYFLFKELRIWQEAASYTPALEDDQFVATLLAAWPTDSIAYFYYGWQLPLDSVGYCSLLGSGIHEAVLQQLEQNRDSSRYFESELQNLRRDLIYDITTSTHFWMPLPAILTELDSILAHPYTCLEERDRIALHTKRHFLQTPQDYQLIVNLFEGAD